MPLAAPRSCRSSKEQLSALAAEMLVLLDPPEVDLVCDENELAACFVLLRSIVCAESVAADDEPDIDDAGDSLPIMKPRR